MVINASPCNIQLDVPFKVTPTTTSFTWYYSFSITCTTPNNRLGSSLHHTLGHKTLFCLYHHTADNLQLHNNYIVSIRNTYGSHIYTTYTAYTSSSKALNTSICTYTKAIVARLQNHVTLITSL